MLGQLEGQQIGRYLIRQRLGGGGVATVYRAYDQVMGQTVALKVLPPNPDSATLNRFRREALMAGVLRHPHIVRILQVGTVANDTSAYIAMDLVEGESLGALLGRFGQLRPQESCRLLEPVARALAFAHSHGVIHRDVKPSNILLRPVNLHPANLDSAQSVNLEILEYPVVPLLSDFGIARFLDAPELTNAGRTVGTPAFMAPEQCMGSREVDGRADIYSLGTVLYRCVVGRLPFNGTTTQILHAHVFEPVVLDEVVAQQLPPRVVEILRRSLAKAPEARYQLADEMADELAAAVEGMGATPEPFPTYAATATATLTLSQPLEVSNTAPVAMQVLVPGTVGVEQAQAGVVPSQVAERRPPARVMGSAWKRGMWATLVLILFGSGAVWGTVWAVSFWRTDSPGAVGELALLPGTTPVVMRPALTSILAPILTPTVMMLATPIVPFSAIEATPVVQVTMVHAAATILPTATPPLLPSPTPNIVLTIAPTPVPVEAVPSLPTPTPAVSTVITPGELIAGTCPTVVDEFFLTTLATLSSELSAEFSCPSAPAEVGGAAWMPFAQGMMVAINDSSLIYVYYATTGIWEQVATDEAGDPQLAEPPAGESDGVVPPPMPFARVWMLPERRLLLGAPLQAEAQQAESVLQPFNGGLLLGNRSDGRVLLLARSKLRF